MKHHHSTAWFPYTRHPHPAPVFISDAVEVKDLYVVYPGVSVPSLADFSLIVPRGSCVALIGPNGAGKSTLLRVLAGLTKFQTGEVRVFGDLLGQCHHRTAYLPQRGDIDWRFPVTAERLVLAGRYVYLGWLRWPREIDVTAAREALDRLGVADLAGRQISALSGGQQQRVLIARAVAQGADLLLLDEPFNNLDAHTRAGLREVFAELRSNGKTLVVATHEADRPAGGYDAVVELQAGRRIIEGGAG